MVPVLVVLSLVGFVGSVTIARFASVEPEGEGRVRTREEVAAEDKAAPRGRGSGGAPAGRRRPDEHHGGPRGGGGPMSWDTVADVASAICLLGGAFLAFAAGVGVLRFPDLLARMHAGTKPQVLGLILVLIGLALRLRSGGAVWALVLVAIFQMLTAPVAAHMVGPGRLPHGQGAQRPAGRRRADERPGPACARTTSGTRAPSRTRRVSHAARRPSGAPRAVEDPVSLIRLNAVGMQFDDKVVLREAFLKLREGDRVGLVGRNGTGKTTFLELILGRQEPTSGTVEKNLGLSIGYFSQFSELEGHLSVVDELSDAVPRGARDAGPARRDRRAPGRGRADDEMNRLLAEQAELFERMDALDGWSYENTIDTVLTRLGFDAERRALPVDQLSGGWRNRAALARILVQGPDVLLLDEPTNFLDLAGRALDRGLAADLPGRGARRLARPAVPRRRGHADRRDREPPAARVRGRLLRVRAGQGRRASRRSSASSRTRRSCSRTRRRRATRAGRRSRSVGTARKLADIKKRQAPRPVDEIITTIYADLHVSENLVQVEGITKGFGGEPLFEDLTFSLHRGDRVAVVGANGSGKSTLLDVLTEVTEPDAGRIVWRKGAVVRLLQPGGRRARPRRHRRALRQRRARARSRSARRRRTSTGSSRCCSSPRPS